jgi:hypothetical protein
MSYRDFVNSFCPITHRFCRNQNPFNLKNWPRWHYVGQVTRTRLVQS